ncbi:MAG: hypothetical protein IPM64_11885 [Phycisphaerales bacterium]|nr:hypothetical protein [Phycisphaerales bacterium]
MAAPRSHGGHRITATPPSGFGVREQVRLTKQRGGELGALPFPQDHLRGCAPLAAPQRKQQKRGQPRRIPFGQVGRDDARQARARARKGVPQPVAKLRGEPQAGLDQVGAQVHVKGGQHLAHCGQHAVMLAGDSATFGRLRDAMQADMVEMQFSHAAKAARRRVPDAGGIVAQPGGQQIGGADPRRLFEGQQRVIAGIRVAAHGARDAAHHRGILRTEDLLHVERQARPMLDHCAPGGVVAAAEQNSDQLLEIVRLGQRETCAENFVAGGSRSRFQHGVEPANVAHDGVFLWAHLPPAVYRSESRAA